MLEIENKLRLLSLPTEVNADTSKPEEIEQHYLNQSNLVFSLISSTATHPGRLCVKNPDTESSFEISADDKEYLALSKIIPVSAFFGQRVLSNPGKAFCARFRITVKEGKTREEFTIKGPTNTPPAVFEANVHLPVGTVHRILQQLSSKGFLNPYPISKTRFKIPADDGFTWDVDCYHNELKGLYTAEKEIPSLDVGFGEPPVHWDYLDVTGDHAFKNLTLSINGFPSNQ